MPSFTEDLLAYTVREATTLAESHIGVAQRLDDPSVRACIARVREHLQAYRAAADGPFDAVAFGAAFERLQRSLEALRSQCSKALVR